MNEDSRQRIISRRVLTPKGDGEGGGGGSEAAPMSVGISGRSRSGWVRSRPIATAARRGTSRCPSRSRPTASWRSPATRRRDSDRRTPRFKVNKPVTLLAAFPRFLTLGDRASFGARRDQHAARRAASATVTIRSLDPALLRVPERTSRRCTLDGGATEPVRFDAVARGVGTRARADDRRARTATPMRSRRRCRCRAGAASRRTPRSATRRARRPNASRCLPAIVPGLGGRMSSSHRRRSSASAKARAIWPTIRTAAPNRKRRRRWRCCSPPTSAARSRWARIAPADYRTRASDTAARSAALPVRRRRLRLLAGRLPPRQLLPHELRAARDEGRERRSGFRSTRPVAGRALDFLDARAEAPAPQQVQWLPVWSASSAFASRCSPSTAATRTRTSRAALGSSIGCRSSRCPTWPTRWRRRRPADRATTTSSGD